MKVTYLPIKICEDTRVGQKVHLSDLREYEIGELGPSQYRYESGTLQVRMGSRDIHYWHRSMYDKRAISPPWVMVVIVEDNR
jgi:hypothetical protein